MTWVTYAVYILFKVLRRQDIVLLTFLDKGQVFKLLTI